MRSEHLTHYLRFQEERCTGCAECLKVCPTKAIRIRNHTSMRWVDLCIGCGACIRACAAGAIDAATRESKRIGHGHVAIALVSPVLYAQFPKAMPKDVLLGLRHMGFRHTIDMSIFLEMFQFAAAEFIRRNRETREAPWPLISPVCPVVVRLIAFQFPSLLAHVLPVLRPVALMAREVKERLIPPYEAQGQQVTLYYLNPCPTMEQERLDPAGGPRVHPEVSIGINALYPELKQRVDAVLSEVTPFPETHFEYETCATANAALVAMSGGEIASMRVDKSMAVHGLRDTIAYLQKIEMGLFQDVEYFEFRTCREGCLGGVLTAVDKYMARSNVQRMLHVHGLGRRVPRNTILQLYDKGRFKPDKSPLTLTRLFGNRKPALSLQQMARIEEILEAVAGWGCGACGAPDCQTFAEDVVLGRAELEDCRWIHPPGPRTSPPPEGDAAHRR
jgi:Na+-translocating ferredoxin:NAD+ oxidoreductase RNF subunit RnfB